MTCQGSDANRSFQPTLLAFTRSDYRWTGGGDHGAPFQPTLLAFTRSDVLLGLPHPLPPVSTHAPRVHEERPGSWVDSILSRVSTHAPRVHEERLRRASSSSTSCIVSTHAPRVHEERRDYFLAPERGGMFQPTLLAFTRSDDDADRFLRPHLQVSTHAPRVHEERRGRAVGRRPPSRVSTHAPRVHEERPAPRCWRNWRD